VQLIKELSSAAGLFAGRGSALIRQLTDGKKSVNIYIYTSLFTQSAATKKEKKQKMISNNKDALSVSGALVARRLNT